MTTFIEWGKLDLNTHNSPLYPIFKKQILEFIRPCPNSVFNVCSSVGDNFASWFKSPM